MDKAKLTAYDDAFNILTQKITHTRILMTLLAHGRAREALSEAEADELDWMLLYGLQAIDEAATAVDGIVRSVEGANHG